MGINKNIKDLWKIKTESGHVKGPFPSLTINKMLVEGLMSGHELISSPPYNEWVPLEKQPEFFEALMESLENPVERDEKKAQKMEAETVIRTVNKVSMSDGRHKNKIEPSLPLKFDKDDLVAKTNEVDKLNQDKLIHSAVHVPVVSNKAITNTVEHTKQEPNGLLNSRDQLLTIEMDKFQKLKQLEIKKLYPFLVGLIILAFVAVYYISIKPESTLGWVLIPPPTNKTLIEKKSDAEVKSLKAKAIALIKTGTLENVRASQKFIVQSIQGELNDNESLGLLCVVYEMLWPYTKQTTSDLKAATVAAQMLRTISPISSYSETCQATLLLIKGQPKDALGMIEKVLDQNNEERFILFPFLFFMKGELLEVTQNLVHAEAYYNEASKAFPGWLWAEFAQARTLYKQEKYDQSKKLFESISVKNANYKPAYYGLALNQVKLNSDHQLALNYFDKGFVINAKLPKGFHLEALTEYIKLLVKQSSNKKAIEVAQFGLGLSPSHQGFKDTIISLGGEEIAQNATSELVFLGDQFARSGDHLAAQAQYKAAFDIDKNNGQIALKAARSLWVINQSREALSWIDRAIKVDSKLYAAYALKADYLSQKYNFIEAGRILSEILKKTSQNFELLKAQAIVEYRKNNLVSALTYGERALKAYDSDVELLCLLANANMLLYLHFPAGQDDESLKNKYIQDAEKFANKAVDLEPGLPEAQITYTKYLYAAKGTLVAENNFKKLIEIFQYTFEYRIGLAEFYEYQEKYKAASEIYAKIVEADNKNKKALIGLARSYQYLNEIGLAKSNFMKAAVLDPTDVEPLFLTAKLELENPGSSDPAVMIKNAFNKFKMVKDLNQNYPLISFYMAKCFFSLGEFDKAIELINEEKKRNPKIAEPWILASQVYEAKKQFKECAAELSQSIKIRPSATELYVRAANCYRESEDIDLAQDMLDIAKERESGFAPIYKEYGYISEIRGLKAEAVRNFQLYLSLSPNAADKKAIENKITMLGGHLQ